MAPLSGLRWVINISLKWPLKVYNKLWNDLIHLVTCKLICKGYKKGDCLPHGEARNENVWGYLLLFPVPGTLSSISTSEFSALSLDFGWYIPPSGSSSWKGFFFRQWVVFCHNCCRPCSHWVNVWFLPDCKCERARPLVEHSFCLAHRGATCAFCNWPANFLL